MNVKSGADLYIGSSRGGGGGGGGGDFQNSEIDRQNFLHRRQVFKKQAKKAFLETFGKMLTKKSSFFGARSPVKFSILGFVSQKWTSQNSTKVDSLGWHGIESLRKKSARSNPPPPPSPTQIRWCVKSSILFANRQKSSLSLFFLQDS